MSQALQLEFRQGVSQSPDPVQAVAELHEQIAQDDAALTLFYCSPEYDIEVLGPEIARRFGDIPMIGCTTAGEITPAGYLNGTLTGVSIPGDDFDVAIARVDDLQDFEIERATKTVDTLMTDLRGRGTSPTGQNSFGFLLIDGLSMQEELFVSAMNRALGNISLFGGSAGDGVRFERTYLYHGGAFHTGAAVFALFHTKRPFEVFKTEHFISSDKKMVVTAADPSRRLVSEINGRPAGREYASMVDLQVDELTPMIFAAHPVVVRLGGKYYVRSIQKVNDDESLSFFCAIDEGLVLTVAEGVDMVENLQVLFDGLHERMGTPELVLGCDCILRHLEVDQRGLRENVSAILRENNVIGFGTYGEQYNAMHVNQTFTGVAIGSRK